MGCVLKSVNKIKCKALVAFALYDNDDESAKLSVASVIRFFSNSESVLYDTPKLFYFQTIDRSGDVLEGEAEQEVNNLSFSCFVCVHAISDTSTLPKFVQTLHNSLKRDVSSVMHILERALENEVKYQTNDIDFSFLDVQNEEW